MFKSLIVNFYREHKDDVLRIVANPFILSLVVAVLIIMVLPPIFNKYKLDVDQRTKLKPHQMLYYADLNNDGISEKIEFRQQLESFFYVTVSTKNKVINQWNFQGKVLLTDKLPVTKAGNDSLRSIWIFVLHDHKIYLNCLNPFENKFLVKNKFVAVYVPKHKFPDSHPRFCTFFDSNKDGIKEFYFFTETGYSKQPREVFKYDPATDSVYSSRKSYADFTQSMLVDTTNHQLALIFASNAAGNSTIDDPYSDMYAWLMCYNRNLSLKYKPVKIGFYPSKSTITPVFVDGNKYFVVMNIYKGLEKHLCSLRLFNAQFKLIKEKKFPFSTGWQDAKLFAPKRQLPFFYIIRTNGHIEKLNSDFKVIDRFRIPPLNGTRPVQVDINGDHQDELAFENRNRDKLIITRNDFSHSVSTSCPGFEGISSTSIKLNGNAPPEFVVASHTEELTLLYRFNYLYYLKYPLYAGIYVIVLLLILLIEKAQKHRAELKYETERSIAELQLKSIKNQLDPHFTLNILNSIGGLFYKQDHEKADYVFGKYSKLLRSMILNSDKIVTTLSGELDYVQNYLELEEFRNGNSFCWKMDIPEYINGDIKIPKMLVHTFVENAIKHGLRHRAENGELYIGITNHSDDYNITIRDNGIGRKQAKQIEFKNTGKGLGILDQILDLYYSLMRTRITYHIVDMTDPNGNPSGTEVQIKIPVNHK